MVALVFCMSLLAFKRFDHLIAKWPPLQLLSYIGKFSYSLYLSHWLVNGIVSQIMKRVYVVSAGNYWISASVQGITAVALARVFFQVAEQPFTQRRRVAVLEKVESDVERLKFDLSQQRTVFANAA